MVNFDSLIILPRMLLLDSSKKRALGYQFTICVRIHGSPHDHKMEFILSRFSFFPLAFLRKRILPCTPRTPLDTQLPPEYIHTVEKRVPVRS